jgi:hypothetical protein
MSRSCGGAAALTLRITVITEVHHAPPGGR